MRKESPPFGQRRAEASRPTVWEKTRRSSVGRDALGTPDPQVSYRQRRKNRGCLKASAKTF